MHFTLEWADKVVMLNGVQYSTIGRVASTRRENQEKLKAAGYEKVTEIMILSLPCRVPTSIAVDLLRGLYKRGVFGIYCLSDFVLINHLTVDDSEKLSVSDKKFWISCLVGSYRARNAYKGIGCNEIGTDLYTAIEREKCSFSKGVIESWEKNKKSVKKLLEDPYSDIRAYHAWSLSIPVKLHPKECMWLVSGLFSGGMFRILNDDEMLFITHMAVTSYSDITEANEQAFAKTLTAVMRTKVIKSHIANPGFNMESYIESGLQQVVVNDWDLSGVHPSIQGAFAEGGMIVNRGKFSVSAESYRALKNAFHSGSDSVIHIPKEQGVDLICSLFPEGLFHMFSSEDCVFMNLLQPCGELTENEEVLWMERLVAGQRSGFINESLNLLKKMKRD
jgi:hypothetical protein